MTPIINYLLVLSIGCYMILIIVDLARKKSSRHTTIELISLTAFTIYLNHTIGFPIPKQSFGSITPVFAVLIMFGCILLGMMARYIFYYKKFKLKSFLRPLVISPIILLPLIGTIQGITKFETVQLFSFGILSFQNGFFWKEIFDKISENAK